MPKMKKHLMRRKMFKKVSMALLLSSMIAFTGCHVTIEDAPEDRAEPALLKDLLPSARSEEPLNELLLKEKDTYLEHLLVIIMEAFRIHF